ncbi:glutamyl-tRNA Gln amidotransferase, A subunit, putative [Theileria equi strain WA]|uniref:Glutamyl-tRNA Gln amidotransferase, A subunit, putative n=1 Tax=Theileria equi strain WA TaxID=1537102 RepID=L0B1L8_THEEQ|nr:glutamyl-tRNA Gln amidotransferase, A subunit, putative [Theileria equi strain WA]AFZ81730.1 glutamyl-tRNA Gln amidotransferase, A subunit, putative [Theileria equi strain WA]|eukprot:XP_004831396.1 glutamyl-tRNA Gln amidotransferase, A subunit, putative [Theileria equi strain WA]
MGAKNFTKQQIKDYVYTFFEKYKEFVDEEIRISVENTACWEYLLKCLESLSNDEVSINPRNNLDRYKAFTYIFDRYKLFYQVVSLVDRLNAGSLSNTKLFGVPIAIKDNITIKDVHFADGIFHSYNMIDIGSKSLEDYSPAYDATVVKSLIEAGLIIIGKTKLDEFGVGSLTDGVINPHGEKYIVGGSSGGSSAVVGGRIVTCALGTDTGGSVRLPSSYCGCYGYRPSYGLISRFGLSELSGMFDTVGIVGDSVYQTALLSHALVCHDIKDMNSSYSCSKVQKKIHNFLLNCKETSNLHRPLRDVKLATFDLEELYSSGYIDEDNKKNMQNVQKILTELGAEIVKVDIARLEACASIYHLYVAKQLTTNLKRFRNPLHNKSHSLETTSVVSKFHEKTIRRLNLGNAIVENEVYIENLLGEERENLINWVERNKLFDEIEFLITPVSVNALPVKEENVSLIKSELYTTIAPILGLCSITIPSDLKTPPLSFQITAGYMQDDKLFRVASAFENFVKKNVTHS